jgi:hypothetical protein
MVPVSGDVFEDEAKGLALGRGQGRDAEIHRLGVGTAGLQNAQGTSSACTTWPSESLKLTPQLA